MRLDEIVAAVHRRGSPSGPVDAPEIDIPNHEQLDLIASLANFPDEFRMLAGDGDPEWVLDQLADYNPTWALLVQKRGRPWALKLLKRYMIRDSIGTAA